MSLMAAGVPLKAPVAGIAMGLVKDGNQFAVLTDILGDEDHLGDMDFKVAGTETGVTALQMDIKILSREEIGLPAEVAYYTRALSLYNPFGNNFFACSRQGCALYRRPIRYAKLFCKNLVLTGLSAPSRPKAIDNLAQPTFRIATGKLIGCDLSTT